jgi:beta-N-acetylhexosaminidase
MIASRLPRGASLRLLFGAVLAAAWLAACGGAHATTSRIGSASGGGSGGGGLSGGGSSSPAAKLTPMQQAGSRIVFAYAGLAPPASLLSQIRTGDVGGVIFFGSNVSSLDQIHAVIKRLQKAARASPLHLPLLLMTDQEGGQVRRLPGAPTRSEKAIGEQRNALKAASVAGSGAGRLLSSVGMNVNLAPVLDVYRTAGDFDDQFQRSYSSDPSKVAALGSAFVTAQQRAGVAATVKHFPGLGAATATENTDERPVTLNVALSQLRSTDEKPFSSAIAAGAKLVMSSWAVYPALDASRPAGLSAKVIRDELRGRLGFKGVTVTDSIDAGALERYGSLGNRTVLAARAGADMILCSQPGSGAEGIAAVKALAHAISTKRIGASANRSAIGRIVALRRHP